MTKKKRGYWKYVLHAAVLIGLVIAATKYINGDEFWRAVRRFNWSYAPFILLLSVAYVGVKGWRFAVMVKEVTDASRWMVLRGYAAAQACTLLPGGIAARAAVLEQAGIPVAKSAAAVAVSSFSDQVVLILCVLVSALWFDPARKPVFVFLSVLGILSLVLGVEASRTWLFGIIEKVLGRFNLLRYWKRFLASLRDLVSPPILLAGIGNSVVAAALMVAALDLAVRGVGAKVSYPTILLAFTLPNLMGRISAMPGGVGVTEAGMVPILDHTPGVTLDQAAAAVIIFRVGTVLFAALFGGAVYLVGWHGAKEKAVKPAAAAAAAADGVAEATQ